MLWNISRNMSSSSLAKVPIRFPPQFEGMHRPLQTSRFMHLTRASHTKGAINKELAGR